MNVDRDVELFGVPLARDKPLELRRSRISRARSGAREIKMEAIINFGID